jgi:lysophospholipase L1-like esterase
MATSYLGNIRGPEGPQGPIGLPGLGAVATDEGVAEYIRAGDDSETGKALDLIPLLDKPPILSHSRRVYNINNGPWGVALAAARDGVRDAKILVIGDSTAAGIGGSSMASYPQRTSWPSYLTQLMDDLSMPAAHGLGIPKSNSSAQPADTRWTLGTGWAAGVTNVGFGGKQTNYVASPGAGALVYNDPRVYANVYDVYYAVSNATTYGQLTIVATGGTTLTVNTGSQSTREIRRATVYAGSASGSNVVQMTNSGASGIVTIVGVEPRYTSQTKVVVGNAGVSGSTTTDWVTYHDGSTTNGWNVFSYLSAYQPDLTIISLGINDAIPSAQVPVSTYIENIKQLIAGAEAAGSSVVLKTMIPSVSSRSAREAEYVAALEALRYPIIDVFNRYGSYEKTAAQGWMADDVHGNDLIYENEAQYMFQALIASPLSVAAKSVTIPTLPNLPVTGWTERWRADQIPQQVGSAVNAFMSVGRTALKPEATWTPPSLAYGDKGRKVLRFNGTTDGLSVPMTRTQPQTVVVLGRLRALNSTSSSGIVGAGQSTGSRSSMFVNSTGQLAMNAGQTLTLSTPTVPLTTQVFTAVFNNTSSVVAMTGTEAAGAAGAESGNVVYVSRLGNTGMAQLDVEEIIIYPRVLSSAERTSLTNALAALTN